MLEVIQAIQDSVGREFPLIVKLTGRTCTARLASFPRGRTVLGKSGYVHSPSRLHASQAEPRVCYKHLFMATRGLRAGPASIYTSKVTNMSMAPLIAGEFPMKLDSWRASSYVVALFVIILCPCAEGFGADPASAPANGGFEQAKDRPDGWRTEGVVSVDAIEPFEGAASLKLYVDPLKLIPTRAVSEAFAVSGNAVEVAGATRSDLYSPDMSFNGNIAIEFLDAAGKAVDTRAVAAISGTTPWKRFRKTVPMAKNAAAARLVAQIEKSNGGFWLDALRATSIAGWLEPSCVVRFSTAQLGNMLYPRTRWWWT